MKATMKLRWMLAGRVSLIALFAAAFPFASAGAQEAEEGLSADEIIVTARKRSESVQDAPLSIQAFGEAQLEQLNVTSFEDYVRFTPSVSFISEGPGQSKVVIRGVAESTGAIATPSTASINEHHRSPCSKAVTLPRSRKSNAPSAARHSAPNGPC